MRLILLLPLLFTSCREIREESLLNNYAIYCIKNNLWSEARFYLERANSISESAKTANNLGVVYEYFGRKEDAILAYKRAIELDKEEVYYKNLASIYPLKIPKGLKNEKKTLKVKIERNRGPEIDLSKIDRLGLLIYADDKNIVPYILAALKEQIIQEETFYIVYQNIPYPRTKGEIKDALLKLLCDNLLLVNVSDYSIFDVKDFDVSERFIKDENRYEFLRTYWTHRTAKISFSLSLFNREGEILFKKDFTSSCKKRYETENPPLYDYSLFVSLLKEGISVFLSSMKPKVDITERWLVKD